MAIPVEKNIDAFNKDVENNKGYRYTTGAKLSSRLANERISDAVKQIADLAGKTVLDIGCGDGSYTFEFIRQKPRAILGIDASMRAIESARARIPSGDTKIEFMALNIYQLEKLQDKFDIAIMRGVLHHLYQPEDAIRFISKVADEVVIVEPNGYNPVLKLIEKFSTYHVEHEERSYFPSRIMGWFRKYGGTSVASIYCGLVPFFCPDWMARLLKRIEPVIERVPIAREISCAVNVRKINLTKTTPHPLPSSDTDAAAA